MSLPAARVRVEEVVPRPPGEVLTALVLRLSVAGAAIVAPRADENGTWLPLPRVPFGGTGHVLVSAEGLGTKVTLLADPPPWPFSLGWSRRTLRRLLR